MDKLYTSQVSSEPAVERERKPYGEYGMVLLSDKEHKDLITKYGSAKIEDYIRRMDLHCASRKPYTNCSAEIKNWIYKDERIAEKKAAAVPAESSSATAPKQNRFINFKQREKDYSELERLEEAYIEQQMAEYEHSETLKAAT